MASKQTKPAKPARGIGAIRADITPDVARDVQTIARMFLVIVKNNPDAIRDAFGPYLKKTLADDPEKQACMVQFYADNAEYLTELFDYR